MRSAFVDVFRFCIKFFIYLEIYLYFFKSFEMRRNFSGLIQATLFIFKGFMLDSAEENSIR